MLLFNPWKTRNNKLHIGLDFLTTVNMRILKDKSSSRKNPKIFFTCRN